jgi:hypothetical protein
MPIENVPSVLEHGILSHNRCKKLKLPHSDISLEGVQDRRDGKEVPNGLKLHDYANLYFCARNPMMYKRRNEAEDLCVLQLSLSVSKQNEVVYTDQNAAGDYVRFLSAGEVKSNIDFDLVFATYWNDENPIEKKRKRLAKCAEILVPHQVEPKFIKGAYVVNEAAKAKLTKTGFSLPIVVESNMFFR